MAWVTVAGSWLPARASTIASEARSAASGCLGAGFVVVVSWGPVGVVLVLRKGGTLPNEVENEDELAGSVVIFVGDKTIELVVVRDVVETIVFVDGKDDTANDVEVDWLNTVPVVVVLGSVEVVKGGGVEVDVVVVSSGSVVVVLDDVVEYIVVVGGLVDLVVGHTTTVLLVVLLVVACITVVDIGAATGVVVLVSVVEVVGSTVVVVSGSVVVVVLVVLVTADVVG